MSTQFGIETIVSCGTCTSKSQSLIYTNQIQLDITNQKRIATLQDCIANFLSCEKIDYTCNNHHSSSSTKQFVIKTCSPVIMFQLSR